MLVPQQVADETRGDLGLDLGHAEQRYLVRAGRRGMPSERAIRSDYRMSGPVIVRPISIRCISLVPSKMVKILAIGAVYAGQRPAAPRGISTDSARPVRDEFRFWAGPVRDWRAGRRPAPVGGRGRPGSWRMPSGGYSAAGISQVHSRADLRLSRRPRYPAARARRGRAAHGPDARWDARTVPSHRAIVSIARWAAPNGPGSPGCLPWSCGAVRSYRLAAAVGLVGR